MSSTIASSILRKFSACRSSLDENWIAPSLVTPSTTCATSAPNSSWIRSIGVCVSSTMSWSSPAAMATTSSFMSASRSATSSGWTRYGSPEWRTCPLCSKAEKTYARLQQLDVGVGIGRPDLLDEVLEPNHDAGV